MDMKLIDSCRVLHIATEADLAQYNQLAIDIGSSSYIFAKKLALGADILFGLRCNTNGKIENIVYVPLLEGQHNENIHPNRVKFEEEINKLLDYSYTNYAAFVNWKNYFYEADAVISFPDSPTIQSNSDSTVRIRISCIYIALYYKLLDSMKEQLIPENTGNRKWIVSMLVPSIMEEKHRQFLFMCFKEAAQLLSKNYQSSQDFQSRNNLNSCQFFVQMKYEALAAVIQASREFKQIGDEFTVADFGGFSVDVGNFIKNQNQVQFQHYAINVAGNTIDTAIMQAIKHQFIDLQPKSFVQLFRLIEKVKQNVLINQTLPLKVNNKQNPYFAQELMIWMMHFIMNSLVFAGLTSVGKETPYQINVVFQIASKMASCLLNDQGKQLIEQILAETEKIIQQNIDQAFNIQKENAKQLESSATMIQIKEIFKNQNCAISWLMQNIKQEQKHVVISNLLDICQQDIENFHYISRRNLLKRELKSITTNVYSEEISNVFRPLIREKIITPANIRQMYQDIDHINTKEQFQQYLQIYCNFTSFSSKDSIIKDKFKSCFSNYIENNDRFKQFVIDYIPKLKILFKDFPTINTISDLIKYQSKIENEQKLAQDEGKLEQYLESIISETVYKQYDDVNTIYLQIKKLLDNFIIVGNNIFELHNYELIMNQFILKNENKIHAKDDINTIARKIQCLQIQSTFQVDNIGRITTIEELMQLQDSKITKMNLKDKIVNYIMQKHDLTGKIFRNSFKLVPCQILKKQFDNSLIQHNLKHFPIEQIEISLNNIILHINNSCYNNLQEKIIETITKHVDNQKLQNKPVIIAGGFANHKAIQDRYNGSLKINQVNLVKGAFESVETINIAANIEQMQSKKLFLTVNPNNNIIFQEFGEIKFKSNRVCVDQGTSGSQGFISFCGDKFDSFIGTNSGQLFDQNNCSRLKTQIMLNKMPSFCYFSIDKYKQIIQQYGVTINKDSIENFLTENYIPKSMLLHLFSFESKEEFDSLNNENSDIDLQLQKIHKLSKIKQEKLKDHNNSQKQLKINYIVIANWKRNLYRNQVPNYPYVPIRTEKCQLEEYNYNIRIPISLLYVAQLLFFKQYIYQKFTNYEYYFNKLVTTITVPCCAQQSELNFIRQCCYQAGFDNNITFITEPHSALYHIMFNIQCYKKVLINGYYLVIDIGGGTTDITLAYIQSVDQDATQQMKKHPKIQVINHGTVNKAGVDIDDDIKQKLNLVELLNTHLNAYIDEAEWQSKIGFIKSNIIAQSEQLNVDLNIIVKDQPISVDFFEARWKSIKNQFPNIQNIVLSRVQQEHKLTISMKKDIIIDSMKSCFNDILMGVKDFLYTINYSHEQNNKVEVEQRYCTQEEIQQLSRKLTVIGVGGTGGCEMFYELLQKHKESWNLQFNIFDVSLVNSFTSQSQQSISRGGVYIYEESSCVSFQSRECKLITEAEERQLLSRLQTGYKVVVKGVCKKGIVKQPFEVLFIDIQSPAQALVRNREFTQTLNVLGIQFEVEVNRSKAEQICVPAHWVFENFLQNQAPFNDHFGFAKQHLFRCKLGVRQVYRCNYKLQLFVTVQAFGISKEFDLIQITNRILK